MIYLIAALLAGVGALNWGAREYLDTDLLTETLGLTTGSGEYSLIIGAIALGGALTIYAEIYWYTERQ